jgi:hypothetical protein
VSIPEAIVSAIQALNHSPRRAFIHLYIGFTTSIIGVTTGVADHATFDITFQAFVSLKKFLVDCHNHHFQAFAASSATLATAHVVFAVFSTTLDTFQAFQIALVHLDNHLNIAHNHFQKIGSFIK